MNPDTTRTQARIEPHDLAHAPLTGSFLAAISLAALERQRGYQADAEMDRRLKEHGVSPMARGSFVALLRQALGAALVRAGERLAGVSQNPLAPEPAAAARTLGTTG